MLPAGPLSIDEIATGEHTVIVAADGYAAFEEVVQVSEDSVSRLDVVLNNRVVPSKHKAGRAAANVGVTLAGLGFAAVGTVEYMAASSAFQDYLAVEDDAEAARIYDEMVAPKRAIAFVLWGLGGATIAGGTALWITTPTSGRAPGIGLQGKW